MHNMSSLRLPLSSRSRPLVRTLSSAPVKSEGSEACQICNEGNSARYTCPTCTIQYCSVACFRSHSTSCTEAFYETRVKQVIELEKDEKAAQELLQRLHDNESDFSKETLFRLWELLDQNESLDDFLEQHPGLENAVHAAVENGDIQEYLLDPWYPWWLPDFRVEVVHLDEKDKLMLDEKLSTVPAFHNISRSKVDLGPNLVDILQAIVYTLKLYHGLENAPRKEAASTLIEKSQVLAHDARYTLVAEPLLCGQMYSVLEDLVYVTANRRLVARGLLEGISLARGKQRKKLEFYLSWTMNPENDCWESLSQQIGQFKRDWEQEDTPVSLKMPLSSPSRKEQQTNSGEDLLVAVSSRNRD